MVINDEETPNPYIGFKANDTFLTNYEVLSNITDMLAQWTDLVVVYVFIAVRRSIKIIISLKMIMLHPTFPGLY